VAGWHGSVDGGVTDIIDRRMQVKLLQMLIAIRV